MPYQIIEQISCQPRILTSTDDQSSMYDFEHCVLPAPLILDVRFLDLKAGSYQRFSEKYGQAIAEEILKQSGFSNSGDPFFGVNKYYDSEKYSFRYLAMPATEEGEIVIVISEIGEKYRYLYETRLEGAWRLKQE